MSEQILIKQMDGSLRVVDHLDSNLEYANAESAKMQNEYDNYVYTIVEQITKIVLSIGSNMNEQYHPKYNTLGTSERVYRSYADEKQAIDFCKGRNSNAYELSLFADGETSMHDWLFETFGSSASTRVIDPVTYEIIISIRKYVYVQNELFGSALEKETTWH